MKKSVLTNMKSYLNYWFSFSIGCEAVYSRLDLRVTSSVVLFMLLVRLKRTSKLLTSRTQIAGNLFAELSD